MSYEAHRRDATAAVAFAVLTVSDTKSEPDDESGRRIAHRLTAGGHTVVARDWSKDVVPEIQAKAKALLARPDTAALVVTGGTGVSPRDVTLEALRPLFAKELPGFGELFRHLSQARIGSGAILSRATAGLSDARGRAKPVFLLPGAPEACELAVDEIIVHEAGHLVALANPEVRRHA